MAVGESITRRAYGCGRTRNDPSSFRRGPIVRATRKQETQRAYIAKATSCHNGHIAARGHTTEVVQVSCWCWCSAATIENDGSDDDRTMEQACSSQITREFGDFR